MRNRSQKGFTLIELLIVIAIIGILAAVLIPNLLNARARAFDTGAQTCLKELGVQIEVTASNAPFNYDDTGWAFGDATDGGVTITIEVDGDDDIVQVINSCEDVFVVPDVEDDSFEFVGQHLRGTTEYTIRNGLGVVPSSTLD